LFFSIFESKSSKKNRMENQQSSNAKTIAIVAYITLIGWIVAIVMQSNENPKSELAAFHLRQSLGLTITAIVGSIVLGLIPFLGWVLLPIWYLTILAGLILGLISAINEEQKPLPVLGEFYQKTLSGLK
jgi:uncharacterized membrane protein